MSNVNINLSYLRSKVKELGREKVRIIPEDVSKPFGNQAIELFEGGSWRVVAKGIDKTRAEKIVSESINRVILG